MLSPVWSAQSSESLDSRALLIIAQKVALTALRYKCHPVPLGWITQRWLYFCRLWTGFRWMQGKRVLRRRAGREWTLQMSFFASSKTREQWGNYLQVIKSTQFIGRREKWHLIIQLFQHVLPLVSIWENNTVYPCRKVRVSERVPHTKERHDDATP